MRTWMLPFVAGVAVVALVVTSVIAVTQSRRAATAEARIDELDEQVAELRDEVRALEDDLEAAQSGGLGDGLEGLLGGLEGLLGDSGGGSADGSGDDNPFAGLFGDDGMADLFGIGGDIPGAACLMPDSSEALSGLDSLLGGLGGGGSAPNDPTELVSHISQQVGDLRELDWSEPVDADFLDDTALHARLEELVHEDLDEAMLDAEARLLTALGALPAGTDLVQTQQELLDDQVAGFYVPETGELAVRVPEDGTIRTLDRVTLAHELNHALTDQALTFPDLEGPPYDEDPDAVLGSLAVIEGDATLLMQQWTAEHVSLTDQLSFAFSEEVLGSQASLEDIPHYLLQELMFPYTAGLDWVCDRYLEGGWAAVDAAYDDPPTTSYEIMTGVRPADRTLTPLDAPDGWELVRDAPFGAAPLSWLFEAPGGDPDRALPDARGFAEAWAAGTARVWVDETDEGRSAVALSLVDGESGVTLCGALDDWYVAAFPDAVDVGLADVMGAWRHDQGASVLRCTGDEVHLAIAPDLPTALAMHR